MRQFDLLAIGRLLPNLPEYVEDEVIGALKEGSDFCPGGSIMKPFVVEDGNLITARYPADAHLFAHKLINKMKG